MLLFETLHLHECNFTAVIVLVLLLIYKYEEMLILYSGVVACQWR